MLAETVATVAMVTALGSLVFAGLQSRELANQTRLSNQLASTSTMRDAVRHLDEFLSVFIDRPELRVFFYGGTAPPPDGLERARVDTLAELLADSIEASLQAALELRSFASANQADWELYATYMFQNSPALRQIVRQWDWWPNLDGLLKSIGLDSDPDGPAGLPPAS